ncbi:MAG: glycosyltransferase family 87 protein [Terriglobales bacterium]
MIPSAAVKGFLITGSVIVLEVATALALVPLTDRARVQSTDFVNFYVAASIVRNGDGVKLYQQETQDAGYQSLLQRRSNQYFLHPAFEAAVLAPLTVLGLERAFILWTLINIALFGFLPLLLMSSIPLLDAKPFAGMLGFCLLPTLTAITLGQDSILLLLLISSSYIFLHKKADGAAGLVLSLATIKFQYVVILFPLLLLSRRWRVATGFALGCVCLMFVSSLITGWHGLQDYFNFVRAFDAHSGYGGLNPALMTNARGFFAGMGWVRPGSSAYWPIEIILIGMGVVAAWTCRTRQNDGLMFALLLTIALAAAPYSHFPDLTVVFLPILLVLDHLRSMGIQTAPRKLLLLCCLALFVWPFVLLLFGGHYWWNSRIYLMFPLLVLFILALFAEVRLAKSTAPMAAVAAS